MSANKRFCHFPSLGLAALVLAFAAPAFAQLTPEDIEALRRRGEVEGWTFTVGESEATRRPLDELCGLVVPPEWWRDAPCRPPTSRGDLPAAYDCCDSGWCTDIRDQGQCGSCWAFAAIGTVESWCLMEDHGYQDLSEQWLVSCTDAGNCKLGGWHHKAYKYLLCNGLEDPSGDSGAVLESDFPYEAKDVPCWSPYPHPYCIPSWAYVGTSDEVPTVEQIKQAIHDYGTVSAAVFVNDAFQSYDE
ncbi:MAG: hypothetical protein JSV78_05910, partial [Phycisphaerales bacterium]